ncbi:MAG: hypothetical protein CMK59_12550 [Proteobacteria bacterium]|nr:hypothetical protein [Pseudomonadota bacterium]
MSSLKKNLKDGIAGATCAGSLIGLLEAIWLIQTTGAPDTLSPLYGVFLYGLLGIPFGIAAGLFWSIASRFVSAIKDRAMGGGALFTLLPIAGFVCVYQIRKVVYAEQMPPIPVLLGVAGGLAVLGLILTMLPVALQNIRSSSTVQVVAAIIGAIFLMTGPKGEDLAAVAHQKPIPDALKDKPNVLLLLVDTLRADHVEAYGKMEIRTPHMDSLKTDGILFEQCISQASWTRPSGVSIFSGRIPSGHNTQTKAATAPEDSVFFTEILHDAGVTTGGFANNINLTSTFNLDQGYDTFLYEAPDYPFGGTESVFGLTFYKVVIKVIERAFPNAERVVEHYYQPASTVFEDSKKFIQANKDSRWMLYAHLMEPHDPYFEHPFLEGTGEAEFNGVAYGRAENENPDPADTEYLKKIYKHEVEYLDLELGRFFKWMKENGVYDNTVIILTSDHGEEFNEHGGFWHGTSLYEEVIHVPLLIKTTNTTINNKVSSSIPWQVRSMDIAPTIVNLMGLEPDGQWEGQELLSDVQKYQNELKQKAQTQQELQASNDSDASKEVSDTTQTSEEPVQNPKIVCQENRKHNFDRIAISENDFEGVILSSIRRDGLKLILANEDNARNLPTTELFDIEKDILELNNIAGSEETICDTPISQEQVKLKAILGEILSQASSSASSGEGVELDEATIERMKALGYMDE